MPVRSRPFGHATYNVHPLERRAASGEDRQSRWSEGRCSYARRRKRIRIERSGLRAERLARHNGRFVKHHLLRRTERGAIGAHWATFCPTGAAIAHFRRAIAIGHRRGNGEHIRRCPAHAQCGHSECDQQQYGQYLPQHAGEINESAAVVSLKGLSLLREAAASACAKYPAGVYEADAGRHQTRVLESPDPDRRASPRDWAYGRGRPLLH